MRYSQDTKKKRTRRILEDKEPKENEDEKRALIVNGPRVSGDIKQLLTELAALKKPAIVRLGKKNQIRPFEDAQPLEFLGQKNNASLFALGSTSKKRPNNLVMGRLFDFHLLDMIELGVSAFRSMSAFGGQHTPGIGMKPCFVFQGEQFRQDAVYEKLANLFLDFFRGRRAELLDLKGVEHVIVLTAMRSGEVQFRHYAVLLRASGTRLPHVHLEEVGPSFDLRVRRTQFGSEELQREARKLKRRMKPATKKLKKNISHDRLGTRMGTVHLTRQDMSNLEVARPKALRGNKGLKKNKDF